MCKIERIKSVISDKGLTIKAFSKAINLQYRTVQRYIGGERAISSEFLEAMADQMDISPSWVLTGKGDPYLSERPNGDFISIPRWNVEASAGGGMQANDENITGDYAFNQKWIAKRGLNTNSLAVISVTGDSMEPDLYHGDLILIDHSDTTIVDTNIYAVRYSNDLFVKRIHKRPNDQISLLSSNKFYDPIDAKYPNADGLQVIGKVVASMHEW